MSNTHERADFFSELSAWLGDIAFPAIVNGTGVPAVPTDSLTLAAFATVGYVRATNNDLCYVAQPAQAMGPLNSGDGTYWLALHRDGSTEVPDWTRQPGSHYLWSMSATMPVIVVEMLLFAQVTVTGGAITAVVPCAPVTVLREALGWVGGGEGVALTNSDEETALLSQTLLPYQLAPTGTLRLECWGHYLNNSGADRTLTLQIYGGPTGTTLLGVPFVVTSPASVTPGLVHLRCDLTNRNDRALQTLSALLYVQSASAGGPWAGQSEHCTLNTMLAQTIRLTAQHAVVHDSLRLTQVTYHLTLLGRQL